MANSPIKSVRANTIPQGGVAATMSAGQGQQVLPDTITLSRMSEQFMDASAFNRLRMDIKGLNPGQSTSFNVQNVGLGHNLELLVKGTMSFNNTAGTAQDISVSPEFPFNELGQVITQFNGSTVVTSLSGYELLALMAKKRKNVLINAGSSAGAAYSQKNVRVDRSLASITAGANVTLTAGDGLCGVSKITVAATSVGVINIQFYIEVPYVLRDDLLLGMLPMQNNSIYASIRIDCPLTLGGSPTSPLFVAGGVPGTLTNSANALTIQPTYNFWNIPNPNDPTLYAYLCSFAYCLNSQANNPLSKTGSEALQFTIPNNALLMSLLLTVRDSGGVLLDAYSANGLDNIYLSYNGTARVDRCDIQTRLARQAIYYGSMPTGQGQILYDATDVKMQANSVQTTKWLNMYLANNPQIVADIAAGVTVPGSFSVLREQLIPSNVQII